MKLSKQVYAVELKTHEQLQALVRRIGLDKGTGVLKIPFKSGGICSDAEWEVRPPKPRESLSEKTS